MNAVRPESLVAATALPAFNPIAPAIMRLEFKDGTFVMPSRMNCDAILTADPRFVRTAEDGQVEVNYPRILGGSRNKWGRVWI